MAIKITQADGSEVAFDTVEEYEAVTKVQERADRLIGKSRESAVAPKFSVGDRVIVAEDKSCGHPTGAVGTVDDEPVWVEDEGYYTYKIKATSGSPWVSPMRHEESELEAVSETHLAISDLATDDGDYSVGDVAEVIYGGGLFDIGDEVTIMRLEGDGSPWAERNSDGTKHFVNVARLERVSKAVEKTEFEVGDKVIALEDGLDITEGNTYEIIETYPTLNKHVFLGDIRITDDEGDGHDVRSEKFKKADSADSRDFQGGDIVYVNEEFTDATGDTAKEGLTEMAEGASGYVYVKQPHISGIGVLVSTSTGGKGNEDRLTLVCRAEDRLDTEDF